MVTVEKLGGNWLIVRERTTNASRAATGDEDAPIREFWTGDGWAVQYGFARPFSTREEAESELEQNKEP